MEIKDIKKLVNLVEQSEIARLEIEESGFRIEIEKESAPVVTAVQTAAPVAHSAPAAHPAAAEPVEQPVSAPEAGAGNRQPITSPMVGTFYARPSPDSPAFVKEGDEIAPGQVVCIIEAMKVMNEIEAEVRGIVRRIVVSDAQPVQYDDPLFEIEPL